MGTVKETFDALQKLRGLEWSSKWGGFAYSLLIFFLATSILASLSKVGVEIGTLWKIYILLGLQFLHLASWLFNRYYFYDSSVLTIAFAISTEETMKI